MKIIEIDYSAEENIEEVRESTTKTARRGCPRKVNTGKLPHSTVEAGPSKEKKKNLSP